MKKVYLTICILLATITLFSGISMAKDIEIDMDDYKADAVTSFYDSYNLKNQDYEIVQTKSNLSFSADSKVNAITSKIFGVVAYICYGALFIVIVIKGVQLMTAAPEAKAEIKKQMIAIAIGGFIVFSIRQILIIISGLNLFS